MEKKSTTPQKPLLVTSVTVRESLHKSKVFFFLKGNREVSTDDMREKLPYAIARALKVSIKDARDITAKAIFSRKAGCSCGCSPGFILQVKGHNIYVDVK